MSGRCSCVCVLREFVAGGLSGCRYRCDGFVLVRECCLGWCSILFLVVAFYGLGSGWRLCRCGSRCRGGWFRLGSDLCCDMVRLLHKVWPMKVFELVVVRWFWWWQVLIEGIVVRLWGRWLMLWCSAVLMNLVLTKWFLGSVIVFFYRILIFTGFWLCDEIVGIGRLWLLLLLGRIGCQGVDEIIGFVCRFLRWNWSVKLCWMLGY